MFASSPSYTSCTCLVIYFFGMNFNYSPFFYISTMNLIFILFQSQRKASKKSRARAKCKGKCNILSKITENIAKLCIFLLACVI